MNFASAVHAFLTFCLLLHRCTGFPAGGVFDQGRHGVSLTRLNGTASAPSMGTPPPPKPLLVAAPREAGQYPVLVFLHGYLAANSNYAQLFRHVASHGFIVVAPQMYKTSGPDATEEINAAAAVIIWLAGGGLSSCLPPSVRANVTKVPIAGHSRGGKVAFALALGYAKPNKLAVPLAALVAVDPVDGISVGEQTPPPILTGRSHSLRVAAPAMVIGTGLGEVPLGPGFPPCAPRGVSHAAFYGELDCAAAVSAASVDACCHLVARDYGHMDMMDDDAPGSRVVCRGGGDREPMRRFVGGATVAFMEKWVGADGAALDGIRKCPEQAPVVLSVVEFDDE
ncbi:unnamed protein product [Urochloa humidicola]